MQLARRETALKAARTQVELARAQAGVQAGVQANLAAYSMLVADAPGVVTAVDAEPGAVLAAGAPVLRLAPGCWASRAPCNCGPGGRPTPLAGAP